jgi:hypothetical protein
MRDDSERKSLFGLIKPALKSMFSTDKPGKKEKYKVEYDEDGNPLSEVDFCKRAFQDAGSWDDYFAESAEAAKANKYFLYISNWDEMSKSYRTNNNKISMEINQCAIYQRALIKENRTISPQVEVTPTNLDIPAKVSETKAGILRYIADRSDTDIEYSLVFQDMLDCGAGALHLQLEQTNNGKGEEEILLKREDIFKCGFDPDANNMFREDGDFAFIRYSVTKQKFKKMFPGKEVPIGQVIPGSTSNASGRYTDKVDLMLYYKRQYRQTKVLVLDTGAKLSEAEYEVFKKQYDKDVIRKKKLYEKGREMMQIALAQGEIDHVPNVSFESTIKPFPQVVKTEKSYFEYICGYTLTQDCVLQRRELNTNQMPLLFSPGDTRVANDNFICIPYAQNAQNAQRFMNYCISEIADDLNCRIKPNIVGTKKNFKADYDGWWNHNRNKILMAEPDQGGLMPYIISGSAVDQGILAAYQTAETALRFLMGMDTDIAKTASDATIITNDLKIANNKGVYQDNLNKLIAKANEGVLKLIPSVYGTERTVIIKSPDGKLDYKVINQDTYNYLVEEEKYQIENDMSIGDFSVEVHGGSSFFAQQILTANFLLKFTGQNEEQLGPLTYDKIIEAMPFLGNSVIANRIKKKITPPDIVADEAGKPPPPAQPNPELEIEKAKLELQAADLKIKQEQQQVDKEKIKVDLLEQFAKLAAQMKEIESKNIESAAQIATAQIKADAENKRSIEEGLERIDDLVVKEEDKIEKMHDEADKIMREVAQTVNMG